MFTQSLLDSIPIKLQRNGGGKHFTGRTKNHSPLLTTQTYIKSSDSVSAFLCFIYIYRLFFNVSFDLFIFSLFYTLLKLLESGFKKTMLFICLSVSVILSGSVIMSSDVCLCVCPCPPYPSLSPKRAPPVPHSDDSISPLFPSSHGNCVITASPNLYPPPHLPNNPGTV